MGEVDLEALASEIAHARSEARFSYEVLNGTPGRPGGLVSRVEALRTEYQWSYEAAKTHYESIERWLGHLDKSITDLNARVAVRKWVVLVLLWCALSVSVSSVVIAAAAVHAWQQSIEADHYALRDRGPP